jgi:hypothetical protein
MKTKDLIKILQEADPSGECHVRVNTESGSGAPVWAEKKEGYWDGYYSYIEDGVMHFSTAGNKVDLVVMNEEDWAMNYPETWEEKIDFHFENYVYKEHRDEKIEMIKKAMSETSDEIKEIEKHIQDRQLPEMIKKIKNGWEIIDNSGDKIDSTKIYFKKGLRKENLVSGYIKILYKTDVFRKEGNKWIINDPQETI